MKKKVKLNADLLEALKHHEVMAYCAHTKAFFKVRKLEVRKQAKDKLIKYYITDKIFVVKRNVIVIY